MSLFFKDNGSPTAKITEALDSPLTSIIFPMFARRIKSRTVVKLAIAAALAGASLVAMACNVFSPRSSENGSPNGPSESQPFAGVTLAIATREPPLVFSVLSERSQQFAEQTGADIQVVPMAEGNLYREVRDDFASDNPEYQAAIVTPQWAIDYIEDGSLAELSDRIRNDSDFQWERIAPLFREFNATFEGNKIYGVPLDGNFLMLYYRQDLLEEAELSPPQTWDEYLAIAEQLHGRDFNGDGESDYGSCLAKQPNGHSPWMFWAIASSFLQTEGSQQGSFFERGTLEPLVRNEAFGAALDIYQATGEYAPENELELSAQEVRSLFAGGRCALTLDWGNTATLAATTQSQVRDRFGVAILPGTTSVLDRETGELAPCDNERCPYAIEGINRAPYIARGGWMGVVNAAASPEQVEVAYAFFSYLSQAPQSSADVTEEETGFDPYRLDHFTERQPWVEAGMSAAIASQYLEVIGSNFRSPNIALDLRVLHGYRYQQEILDRSLTGFLQGILSRQAAMENIYWGWQGITNDVGRDRQQSVYRNTLGVE